MKNRQVVCALFAAVCTFGIGWISTPAVELTATAQTNNSYWSVRMSSVDDPSCIQTRNEVATGSCCPEALAADMESLFNSRGVDFSTTTFSQGCYKFARLGVLGSSDCSDALFTYSSFYYDTSACTCTGTTGAGRQNGDTEAYLFLPPLVPLSS